MAFIFEGKTIQTDKEGYISDLSLWSEAIAEFLADKESIVLTDKHWEMIYLIRKFYTNFEISPAMRPLVKFTENELGKDKGNSLYLLSLFPGSPAKVLSKIAGLPRPTNCL